MKKEQAPAIIDDVEEASVGVGRSMAKEQKKVTVMTGRALPLSLYSK